MNHLIEASGLSLFRGERCLFSGLNFALNSGEVLILRGPNGSGKTSLLRGLCGLLEFEDGTITWDGERVRDAAQEFRGQFAWYGHKTGFKGDLNAEENLRFERSLRPVSSVSIRDALDKVGLSAQRSLPVRSLSAGQQRRASLARLLLADVPLWIMDEPFTNLDAAGRELVNGLVDSHLDAGGMALVATHLDLTSSDRTRILELGQ